MDQEFSRTAWVNLDATREVEPIGPADCGKSYCEFCFLRSAQRFFIANDSRFLPCGVMPPAFLTPDLEVLAA
jgi:hypothetical protein